jgi:hypothetical protein
MHVSDDAAKEIGCTDRAVVRTLGARVAIIGPTEGLSRELGTGVRSVYSCSIPYQVSSCSTASHTWLAKCLKFVLQEIGFSNFPSAQM